ncbi:glycosyltransferase family 4 protein [Candidatus Chloroploca asiatica]|nr:glycosyltransferase family 1 protein [Candidatus Chloroploca asiatica]
MSDQQHTFKRSRDQSHMQVELVAHNPIHSVSGIGRYVRELYAHLQQCIAVRIVHPVNLPLADRFEVLRHFPVGLSQHQPGSIVHFTQIMGCAQMLWRPFRPAIATVHDLGVLVCPEDSPLHNPISRRVLSVQLAGLRKMNYYAVNSIQTRDDLIERLGIDERRIHHVQLGVDIEHFRVIPDAHSRLAATYGLHSLDERFNLLYVGSELPRKNVGMIIESLAILRARGYPVRLLKVGSPGGQRWRDLLIEQIVRLKLEDAVIFFDVVPEEDLPLFYNIADLCVTATLLEGGFAWMVMEALACERPVVATTAAAIPDDARPAVSVVPTRNREALTDAIATCLDNSELRRQMGQHGLNVIGNYDWSRTIRELLQLYAIIAKESL